MKEFENHRHYSEQAGHKQRSRVNRVMRETERLGFTEEQRVLIKQRMRRIEKDGR